MPEFPRANSERALTTQQPRALRNDADIQDRAGKLTKQTTDALGATQEAMTKWQTFVESSQKDTALLNYKTGLQTISDERVLDSDISEERQQYYQKKVIDLQKSSIEGISSEHVKAALAPELNYMQTVGMIGLNAEYRKKVVVDAEFKALKFIDGQIQRPGPDSLKNIENFLDEKVALNLFDKKQAYKLLRDANKDLGVNRVSNDLNKATSPEEVEQVRQNITSGYYETGGVTISPEEKKSLLEVADRAEKNTERKVAAEAVKMKVDNRLGMITGIAEGSIDPNGLNMGDVALKDPELAATITQAKDFMVDYDPTIPMKEQPVNAYLFTGDEMRKIDEYQLAVTETFMQNDNETLSDFVLKQLKEKGDGSYSSVKLGALINLAMLKAKANAPQTAEDLEKKTQYDGIKNAIAFLSSSNPFASKYSVNEFMTRQYLSKDKSPEEAQRLAKETLRDIMIGPFASLAGLPALPNKIVDGDATITDIHSGLNELKAEKTDKEEQDGGRKDNAKAKPRK